MRPRNRRLSVAPPEHLCALIGRVSTDMQVRNPEGSLTTQFQRLRQHLQLKEASTGESWREVMAFRLEGVSGSRSLRSDELEPLYAAIREGRVNTVVFTALNRLCRSLTDFLDFIAFLQEHDANFVSLKEAYDTTSAHGRLIYVVLMALAEFEREQTAERTRDAFRARSERGLWNGSRVLGYDLDPDRKGYLIPNANEVAMVNFAFDSYLQLGTIAETVAALNRAGHRTKEYRSRRGVEHAARELPFTTVQHMLSNVTYIAKKLVADDDGEERLVDAVWPAIIDDAKFAEVQRLLAENGRSKRSTVKPTRHAHVLSQGLLFCARCGSRMTGRSGTGRGGVPYFYYRCEGESCTMSVVAHEVEDAILDRLSLLAGDAGLVDALCAEANGRRLKEIPALEKRLRAHHRSLRNLKGRAAKLLQDARTTDAGRGFIEDELSKLEGQRAEIEAAIVDTGANIRHLHAAAVTPEQARCGLTNFRRTYEHLQPGEKHELIRLILKRAEVGDKEIVLELYEEACAAFAQASKSDSRFARPGWLPEPGDFPKGLEFDVALYVDCGRKRTDGERRYRFSWDEPPEPMRPAPPRKRLRPNPVSVARDWQRSMEERGESKAELARRLGVTRARVTQVLKVLDLDPAVLAFVERNPDPRITERALRSIVHRPPQEQLTHVDQLLASTQRTKRRTSSGSTAMTSQGDYRHDCRKSRLCGVQPDPMYITREIFHPLSGVWSSK